MSGVSPAIARAQDAEDQITVTATGAPTDLDQTGEPVTVIGREEIEAVQGADLTRMLARVPGVSFSRNGTPGSFTGVRVRGAEAEQLLVLIDGVRVADPAAPGGGFDFGNLMAGDIGKIDLLRSSNSTVWGSDAIGGVLAITTRADSGLDASGEYGARDTADASLSGGVGGTR
ncbi:MAG TPA: TonB-dependent receptor plug domain-containing protein, partial [Croceibacterium sp.]